MKELEKEFAAVVQENKATIYTVCYMFSADREEVEDLFQEALIALWRGFSSFRGESNIRSWIYRVALNTCISSERKKRRRDESVRLDMSIDLFTDTDDDSRQAQMLRQRIGKLGPSHRSALAREPLLRGDRCHCGHHRQECLGASGTHPRATQKYVERIEQCYYELRRNQRNKRDA